MKQSENKVISEVQDRCNELIDHIKLLRDYATTPGNAWLAKGEMAKIQQISVDIDNLLSEISNQ